MRGFEQGMIQSLGEVEQGVARLDQRLVRPVTPGMYLADFLALPGLRGVWPTSQIDSNGNVYSLSNANALALLYNGNPLFNQYSGGGLALPYLDLDGTGDYIAHADSTELDISGTETIFASAVRGITFGGWCWWDVAGTPGVTNRPFMTKERTTTFSPYQIFMEDAATQRVAASFSDSDAGTNRSEPITTSAVSLNAWHCVIAKFIAANIAKLFVDGTFYTASAAAVASLYNSTGTFEIGAGFGTTQFLDGRVSFCFLCANALPDAWLDWLWTRGRVLFNV